MRCSKKLSVPAERCLYLLNLNDMRVYIVVRNIVCVGRIDLFNGMCYRAGDVFEYSALSNIEVVHPNLVYCEFQPDYNNQKRTCLKSTEQKFK